MGTTDMVRLLDVEWERVVSSMSAAGRRDLVDLLVAMAEPGDRETLTVALVRLKTLLVQELGGGDPVVAIGNRLAVPSRNDVGLRSAVARLRMRAVDRYPWPAEDRILSTAWEAARNLRARGVDPDLPELIRLNLPNRDVAVPMFQFDEFDRPRELVLRVNYLLDAFSDPWGVADWWLSGNIWLHQSPVDSLDGEPELVMQAATAATGR